MYLALAEAVAPFFDLDKAVKSIQKRRSACQWQTQPADAEPPSCRASS